MSTAVAGHNLVIPLFQNNRTSAYGIRDVRTDFPSMTKELGNRAVGNRPELAGRPWSIGARSGTMPDGGPGLVIEATVAGQREPLATRAIPVQQFESIARSMAASVGLSGDFTFGVVPVDGDNPLVLDWNSRRKAEQTDFVLEETEFQLRLPDDFTIGEPPGRWRVIHEARTWLRCLFRRECFEQFLQAAAAEQAVERAWIGTGDTYLAPDECTVVISELIETAGESTWSSVTTDGLEVDRLRRELGDRRQAYCHLHPPFMVDDEGQRRKVLPVPSGADLTLAMNFDRVPRPTVYPLCLFGVDPERPGGDLAVYGFQDGILIPITTLLETE